MRFDLPEMESWESVCTRLMICQTVFLMVSVLPWVQPLKHVVGSLLVREDSMMDSEVGVLRFKSWFYTLLTGQPRALVLSLYTSIYLLSNGHDNSCSYLPIRFLSGLNEVIQALNIIM